MANLKPRKRGRQPAAADPASKPKEPSGLPARAPVNQPVSALRKYIQRYDLPISAPMTLEGFMLRGAVGSHSESGQKNKRSAYGDASRAVQDHLQGGLIKEGDAIAEFLYAVTNRKHEFKLRFGEIEKRKQD